MFIEDPVGLNDNIDEYDGELETLGYTDTLDDCRGVLETVFKTDAEVTPEGLFLELTDTDIIDEYDGELEELEHIEGVFDIIADTVFGVVAVGILESEGETLDDGLSIDVGVADTEGLFVVDDIALKDVESVIVARAEAVTVPQFDGVFETDDEVEED